MATFDGDKAAKMLLNEETVDEVVDADIASAIKNIHNVTSMMDIKVSKEDVKIVLFALAQLYDSDKKKIMQFIQNIFKKTKKFVKE